MKLTKDRDIANLLTCQLDVSGLQNPTWPDAYFVIYMYFASI
jgi:hypothetical protein